MASRAVVAVAVVAVAASASGQPPSLHAVETVKFLPWTAIPSSVDDKSVQSMRTGAPVPLLRHGYASSMLDSLPRVLAGEPISGDWREAARRPADLLRNVYPEVRSSLPVDGEHDKLIVKQHQETPSCFRAIRDWVTCQFRRPKPTPPGIIAFWSKGVEAGSQRGHVTSTISPEDKEWLKATAGAFQKALASLSEGTAPGLASISASPPDSLLALRSKVPSLDESLATLQRALDSGTFDYKLVEALIWWAHMADDFSCALDMVEQLRLLAQKREDGSFDYKFAVLLIQLVNDFDVPWSDPGDEKSDSSDEWIRSVLETFEENLRE